MIDLRLLSRVPEQAAPLAYVSSKPMSVMDNVSLVDYSRVRTANSVDFYQAPTTVEYDVKTAGNKNLYTKYVVVGNRSVLSPTVGEGQRLFYRYRPGGWPSIFITADSGTVSVEVGSNSIKVGSTTYSTVNKTVREVVKTINDDSGNGVAAYTLHPTSVKLKSGAYVATTTGITIKNNTYVRVYNTEASVTDLDAARETIKRTIEILADGEKAGDLAWDIVVDEYETNGFLVSLYVDRKNEDGKTYQIRYPAISQAGTVQNNRTEVVNALPYLIEGLDYTLTDVASQDYWRLTAIADSKSAMAIGVFGAGSVDVTTTQITIIGTSYTYTGKNLRQAVADLNSTFTSHTFTLLNEKVSLDATSLETGTFTIKAAGIAIRLKQEVNILSGPSVRIHPLLPYDEEIHRPWYPRIHSGRFSELHYTSAISYYPDVGGPYNGKTKLRHNYGIPEYTGQTFSKPLGSPYKSIAGETPIVVGDRIIRTRRFPLESLGSIKLRSGDTIINSKISDVDLEQGFLFLTEPVQDIDNLAIDYVYEEESLVYTGIDLNTAYNPTLVGKFVGVYAIPEEVSHIWPTTTRTVYHIVRDTAAAVVTAVKDLAFANGVNTQALLVGVYQVLPTQDRNQVVFLDADRHGGGVDDGVVLEEESQFVTDVGRWDGLPFDPDQTLVMDVPDFVPPSGDITYKFRVDPAKLTGFMDPTGQLSRQDIERLAQKWVGAGTFLIVEPG